MTGIRGVVTAAFCLSVMILGSNPMTGIAALTPYLKDRGAGQPTSIFGTYIRAGELLVYPFVEWSRDHNHEYQPVQFGLASDTDFRGHYLSVAEQTYVGYGISDGLAVEFEAAHLKATFDKAWADQTGTPTHLEETGTGDIEAKLRWRWKREYLHSPEIFSFFDVTVPSHRNKRLIGDADWQFMPGLGIIRGFRWGTLTLRSDLEYNHEAGSFDVGETALEYLKQLTSFMRGFLALEGGEGGAPDEWSLIAETQWRIANCLTLKLNSSFGLSSKAPDWEPQIGLLFSMSRSKA